MWEKYLVDTFTAQTGSKSEYILYRSEQVRHFPCLIHDVSGWQTVLAYWQHTDATS